MMTALVCLYRGRNEVSGWLKVTAMTSLHTSHCSWEFGGTVPSRHQFSRSGTIRQCGAVEAELPAVVAGVVGYARALRVGGRRRARRVEFNHPHVSG